MEGDKNKNKNVSLKEFNICQYESSILLQIKICHQFALVQISGGDGGLFVLYPRHSLKGYEIKPVAKQLLYWKERLSQHCRAPFILINTRVLEFICKAALTPLVKSTPPSVSPLNLP